MQNIIERICSRNPTRKNQDIYRRLSKLYEEFGELNQALLNVTSRTNPKNKTDQDILEELVDVSIMCYDLAFTFANSKRILSIKTNYQFEIKGDFDVAKAMSTMLVLMAEIAKDISTGANNTESYCVQVSHFTETIMKLYATKNEIEKMYNQKLDKWEKQVSLKQDLCPTE